MDKSGTGFFYGSAAERQGEGINVLIPDNKSEADESGNSADLETSVESQLARKTEPGESGNSA
jgi:hypothetical protein